MTDANPDTVEFSSWRSYWDFARHAKEKRRYVWNEEVRDFLNSVAATRYRRDTVIKAGSFLWRAQRGVCRVYDEKRRVEDVFGFSMERMKPVPEFTGDGRANSAGIPVLYLASTEKTAVSEVRPWIGSEVSVAKFRVLRNLKAIDLTKRYGNLPWGLLGLSHYFGWEEPDVETREEFVWSAIDKAFSDPVEVPENVLDYIPTQILAEFFLDLGYDAIVYRSQFGESGSNVAVFNLDDAEVVNCTPHEVTAIDVDHKAIGNP